MGLRGRESGWLTIAALCGLLWPATPARAEVYVFTDARGVIHLTDNPRHAGYRRLSLLRRERVDRPPALRVATRPGSWDPLIARMSSAHGVEPALVKAVIHAESAFDPRALSHKGAQGLMQLMPGTARTLGVDDAFNPWQNIDGGTRHLRYLMRLYDGKLPLVLAAYNAGEAAVRRFSGIPPYRETRRYVDRVIKLYRRYDGDFR